MTVPTIQADEIGLRIAQARQAAGYTRKARFARAIGAEPKTLLRIERGENVPTVRVIAAIARETGVGVEWIIHGEGRGPLHAEKVRRRTPKLEAAS